MSSHPITVAVNSEANLEEFLVFSLGQEFYGVSILHVQEIRSYEVPTSMVHAPDYVRGVVNLRGIIVPIVDLRLKLACALAEITEFTVVIFLNLGMKVVGVVVDAVADVIALPVEAIKAAPQFESTLNAATVRGIASVDARMLIVMDIAALLDDNEMGVLQFPAAA